MIKMPHWPVPLGKKPINMGLERVQELLKRLGNPEQKLPPVVYIAGTNGKGSTLAFVKAFLENAGYKTHRYTSPHLVWFNERIELAGQPITDEFLYEVLEECRVHSDGIEITFFEGTTVAAFLAFSKVSADAVLLETGMGGRLDASNVISKPAVTILAPISFDHMEFLGDTIVKIAAEKAAIIKPGVPCVVSEQMPEAMKVIEAEARAKNAPLFRYGIEWTVEKKKNSFIYQSDKLLLELSLPALAGSHQIMNAGAAIATIEQIEAFHVSPEAIAQSLNTVSWPARLQHITRGTLADLLPKNAELWLDGGHNAAGGKVLADWAAEHTNMPLYLIVGMLKGKETAEFLKPLTPFVTHLMAGTIPEEEKALSAKDIEQIAEKLKISTEISSSVVSSIASIGKKTSSSFRILICGSLYLAGSVLAENE